MSNLIVPLLENNIVNFEKFIFERLNSIKEILILDILENKHELAALAAAARKSGEVRVKRVPEGKQSLKLSNLQWQKIHQGDAKVDDFVKPKPKMKRRVY